MSIHLRTRQLFALVALAACGCSPSSPEVGDGWELIDLWDQKPTLSGRSEAQQQPVRTTTATLRARRVKAVQHQPGQRLHWRIELGREPTFSFRPHPVGGSCTFEVQIESRRKEPATVYRSSHEPIAEPIAEEHGDALGDQVDVDLAAFANQSVELILGVEQTDDCHLAQWSSPVLSSRRAAAPTVVSQQPNILLIAADTLRTDALGSWGRTPSVTPTLDRLASTSDLWLQTYASCNSTNPSFASLMTGLYVKNHGVFNLRTPLPEKNTTLAELLQQNGYETSAVVSVRHLADFSGLRQGFDRFHGPAGQFFAETVVNMAIQEVQKSHQPFFLWVHLFDPHTPQNPPAPFHLGYRPAAPVGLQPVNEWIEFRTPGARPFDVDRSEPRLLGHEDLYPGEVSYLDWQIGRLLGHLDSRGLLDNTIVIFVADHGESLGERGVYFNHVGLFEQTVHVPLLIHWPGQTEGREYNHLVQHFDIFPTVLNYLGIEPPPQDGLDLGQVVRQDRGRVAVFANHANDHGEMVRTESFKYYRNRAPYRARGVPDPAPLLHPRGIYFFDLESDPEESQNLAGRNHEQEPILADVLDDWLSSRPGATPASLDLSAEDRAQLEALGYVE